MMCSKYKLRLCAVIVSLFLLADLYAVNDPQMPEDPSGNFSFNDINNKPFHTEIICAGRDKISGIIYLRITGILCAQNGKRVLLTIEEIRSIEFLEWKEVPYKKDVYIFYPSRILLTMKGGQQYILHELPEFNSIEFSEREGRKKLFTYFYDYWENNSWRNSCSKYKSYPENNPLPGTVVKINFKEKENNTDSIERILKSIFQ